MRFFSLVFIFTFMSCAASSLGEVTTVPFEPLEETPTWTDAKVAHEESPEFAWMGEYASKKDAIQVVPCQGRFYLSIYQGGFPGAGWDRKAINHQWVALSDIQKRLWGYQKVDRSKQLAYPSPPENSIVLFDGTGKDEWAYGKIKNGLLQAGAKTKRQFRDFKLHFECLLPYKPGLALSHPHRGNSGVFALGAYEIQIADTFGLDLSDDAWTTLPLLKKPNTWCGSIYGIHAPELNMCLPPLSWQTFDVVFHAAKFEGTRKTQNARMSVWQNGVQIHDDVALPEGTGGGPSGPRPEVAEGPLVIQNHHNPTQYRNVWIAELND